MKGKRATHQAERANQVATHFEAKKNQGYQLPIWLWQELHAEAGRRKRLGLPLGTQNAIACAALRDWLEANKGGE